jgi:hypothetical protein
MSLTEAQTAVCNVARALRDRCPLTLIPEGAPVRPLLAQLYAAVEVVDAVGDAEVPLVGRVNVCPICECLNPPGVTECITCTAVLAVARAQAGWKPLPTEAVVETPPRPGLCQGDPECERYADLPTGTCYHHSPAAQRPRPFERAVMRAAVFEVWDG